MTLEFLLLDVTRGPLDIGSGPLHGVARHVTAWVIARDGAGRGAFYGVDWTEHTDGSADGGVGQWVAFVGGRSVCCGAYKPLPAAGKNRYGQYDTLDVLPSAVRAELLADGPDQKSTMTMSDAQQIAVEWCSVAA